MTFKLHKDFIMAVSKLWKVTNRFNIIDILLTAPFHFIIKHEWEILKLAELGQIQNRHRRWILCLLYECFESKMYMRM